MGLLAFIKEAGEKLFGTGKAKAADEAVKQNPTPENVQAMNDAAAEAIAAYIGTLGLEAEDLKVGFDGASATASVFGRAANQPTKEKILLAAGNVHGVAQVEDGLDVAEPEPEAQFYTVVRGDTLSKIAKDFYGNPNRYPAIFEANRPMLGHPDKIYPGQVLRIPPQA